MADDEDGDSWETKALNNFERNKKYVRGGKHNYNTKLSLEEELQFRQWVKRNNVIFDPNAEITDYDMRGFWKAMTAGDPLAKSAINPYAGTIHRPDYWKTPYHESFSAQSQWATPDAPNWKGNKLIDKSGNVLFQDKPKK